MSSSSAHMPCSLAAADWPPQRVVSPALLGDALTRLTDWIETRDYKGYDPYDGLNAVHSRAVLETDFISMVVTQLFKKSPLDVRERLGMPRIKMAKTVGLCLNAYAVLAADARRHDNTTDERAYLSKCAALTCWLEQQAVTTYGGYGWNFGFRYRFMADMPTVVITAIVARGLFEYHRLTQSPVAERLLMGACAFVMTLLKRERTGIWFSYTPTPKPAHPLLLRCCYNASMLGAEILAMGYALGRDSVLREYVDAATDFIIQHQKPDGRWNYSVDLNTGRERRQVDFHQGFILDSLQACMTYARLDSGHLRVALREGADFYRRMQFTDDGRALWRLPRSWPADIHCQAQGVITFSKLADLQPNYRSFAERIALWTIENMQTREGYFVHRKGRLLTNRIPYMRWGQAWMMLALAHVVTSSADERTGHARGDGTEFRSA